jgi:hypothetical protein
MEDGKAMRSLRFVVPVLVMLVLLCAAANASPTCKSGFPNGIQGTLRVWVGVYLKPQSNRSYVYPESHAQEVKDSFIGAVNQDVAGNPSGPQLVWVDDNRNPADVYDGLSVYTSGGTTDVSDRAWIENAVSGMKQSGSLFIWDGPAFTAHDVGGDPEQAAVVDGAHKFYTFIAYGWKCGN